MLLKGDIEDLILVIGCWFLVASHSGYLVKLKSNNKQLNNQGVSSPKVEVGLSGTLPDLRFP